MSKYAGLSSEGIRSAIEADNEVSLLVERIEVLESSLKEIYALTGEDEKISEIFNRVMK